LLEPPTGPADKGWVPTQPRSVVLWAIQPIQLVRRFTLTGAALLLLLSLIPEPAGARNLEAARARLASVERQIERQQAVIGQQHERLDAMAGDLARVQAALQETQAQLGASQQRLADATARYEASRDLLQDVTRTAYQQGPLAPVEALLAATSLTDLVDRYQYLNNIQVANAEVADGVADEAAELSAATRELDTLASRQIGQSIQLQAHNAALRVALLEQQRQLAQLNAQRRKAAQLVQRLSLRVDPAITGAGTTFGNWASLLLSELGAPHCRDNLTVLVAWQVAEGTAAAHNPLATTHYMPGSTSFNSVGVRNFSSVDVGLQATVETLRLPVPSYGYQAILSNLANCAPAKTTAMAINASSWCRGCAGGLYVVNVLPLVQADYAAFSSR
jgi:peptidoglycan hydrolase CwlO-like protein